MRGGRAILPAVAATILTGLPLGSGPEAEPRKLGLADLTRAQEKELWDRTDRYAGYAALLTLCRIETNFERRFVAAAEPCVDPDTVKKVVAYFRSRYAAALKNSNTGFCSDGYVVSTNLADRLRLTLEDQIAAAQRLCGSYR